jgi:thymidine kinase
MKERRIELIFGPMFAGKTTEMLRRIRRAEYADKRVALIKYSKDCRYGSNNNITTHDLLSKEAHSVSTLLPLASDLENVDVIGLDEGQFYPDVVDFAHLMKSKGKTLIIASLDGDFLRRPFGFVLDFIPKADSVEKLSAICKRSGKLAPFTMRTVSLEEIEVIGGEEMCQAASRNIHQNRDNCGSIHLILGERESGKSTEIKSWLWRKSKKGKKCLLLQKEEEEKKAWETWTRRDLPTIEEISDFDVVGIDDADEIKGIEYWADEIALSGKEVFVSCLSRGQSKKELQRMKAIFSRSESVKFLDESDN